MSWQSASSCGGAEKGAPWKHSWCPSPMWAAARGMNASAFLLNFLHFFQGVFHNGVLSLELKVATKQLSLKHQWEPKDIIWPHLFERHLIQLKPLRLHFCWGKKQFCLKFSHGFLPPGVPLCQQTALGYSPAASLLWNFCRNSSAFMYEQCISKANTCQLCELPTIAFLWLSMKLIRSENVNFHQFRVAYEFKSDLTHLLQGVHSQPALFQELPVQKTGVFIGKQAVGEQKAAVNFTLCPEVLLCLQQSRVLAHITLCSPLAPDWSNVRLTHELPQCAIEAMGKVLC